MTKIFAALCSNRGVQPETMASIMAAQKGFGGMVLSRATPLDKARNDAVRKFLESDCEYLLWLDDDMIVPPNIMDIFETGPALCAPLSVLWDYVAEEPIPAVYDWSDVPPHFKAWTWPEIWEEVAYIEDCRASVAKEDPERAPPFAPVAMNVGAVGVCWAVRRDVFEKTRDADGEWFKWNWDVGHGPERGEDVYFFKNAHAAGYSFTVHLGVVTGHVKAVDLSRVVALLRRQWRREGKKT